MAEVTGRAAQTRVSAKAGTMRSLLAGAIRLTLVGAIAVPMVGAQVRVSRSSGTSNGEWRTYGADLANTRYSPLDQINASNFSSLEVAWRLKTENLGPRPGSVLSLVEK